MKYCNQCVIPKTSSVKFDEKGICNICKNWNKYRIENKGDFSSIVKKIKNKNKNKKFDCVVGYSGGRDSTYVLYKLTKIYNLRCVAIFGKTVFTPQETIDNVIRITNNLGIKLYTIEIPFKQHLEFAKTMVNKWKTTQNPLFANIACSPCKLVNREIYKKTKELKINTIIYGGNPYEFFHQGPSDTSKKGNDKFGLLSMSFDNIGKISKGIKLVLSNIDIIKYLPLLIKASIMYCNQYSPYIRIKYRNIVNYDLFHYDNWDEDELNSILKKFEWKLPEGCVSTWRADCIFEEVKNYMFNKNMGMNHINSLFSNLIRENKLTRNQAIERLKSESSSEIRLQSALKKLQISNLN